MALFEKGRAKTGGRAKGARNKLSMAFVEALAKEFDAHGEEAIRIMRKENPADFLKIVAAIVPKEFEITDSRLNDIPDAELDAFIEFAKRHLARGIAANADGGKEPSIN
jgi:hypothetical protein